jgi:zinc transport system substrate-binding protein
MTGQPEFGGGRWRLLALGAWLAAAALPAQPASQPVQIVTSFYPMYVATLNVAAGLPGVQVVNMTRPVTGCLHDYQLAPEDMITLTTAAVFVVNGAGMESFLDKAVRHNRSMAVVDASAGIELIRGGGAGEGDVNPHVWVSVSDHLRQVANIAAGLAKADPARAARYAANAAAYGTQLEALRAEMHEALAAARGRPIVTFHEAFPYFAREFELRVVAVVEREPGSEPNAQELAATIRTVRTAGVRALFAEPQYPVKAAELIARETQAKVYTLDPVVSGPLQADAYLVIMRRNLRVLREALQ